MPLLTATSLLSAIGTYAVFVAVARGATRAEIASYVLTVAIATATAQVADAGDAILSARNSLVTTTDLGLSAGLRRRLLLAVIAAAVVAGLVQTLTGDRWLAVIAASFTATNSFYWFVLVAAQARQQFAAITVAQLLNATLFAVGAGLTVRGGVTAAQAVAVHLVGTFVPTVLLAWLGRDLVRSAMTTRVRDPEASTRRRWSYFRLNALAALVVQIETVALGVIAPGLLPRYAAGQRPAAAMLTVVSSLHRFALPRLARMNPGEQAQILRVNLLLLLAAPLAGVAALYAARPVFEVLYPAGLQATTVFAVLVAAYVIDLASVYPQNVLLLMDRTSVVAAGAASQVVLLLLGAVLAWRWQTVLVAASAVPVAKLVHLVLVYICAAVNVGHVAEDRRQSSRGGSDPTAPR